MNDTNSTSIKNLKKLSPPHLKSIREHLEYDDNFLKTLTNNSPDIYIRFWELTSYAIILGRSNSKENEVKLKKTNTIPIIKRASGGGTVLLGPGCLCYSLFIPTGFTPCSNISKTNSFIMNTLKDSLEPLNSNITIRGYIDLCINDIKFSGNAQRRTKDAILFHGTILYNFDLQMIEQTLKHPSKEPDYRKKRSHKEFLTNLSAKKTNLINCLSKLKSPHILTP